MEIEMMLVDVETESGLSSGDSLSPAWLGTIPRRLLLLSLCLRKPPLQLS